VASPCQLQRHLLAELAGEILDQAREAAEHRRDRHHAHAHHRFLQLAAVALELGHAAEQPLVGERVEQRRRPAAASTG
jgi:hypothetical protein